MASANAYDPTKDPDIVALKTKYFILIKKGVYVILGLALLLVLATLFVLWQAR